MLLITFEFPIFHSQDSINAFRKLQQYTHTELAIEKEYREGGGSEVRREQGKATTLSNDVAGERSRGGVIAVRRTEAGSEGGAIEEAEKREANYRTKQCIREEPSPQAKPSTLLLPLFHFLFLPSLFLSTRREEMKNSSGVMT